MKPTVFKAAFKRGASERPCLGGQDEREARVVVGLCKSNFA